MAIWLTFLGVALIGGLLVFLLQRREPRRLAEGHSLDHAPPLGRRNDR